MLSFFSQAEDGIRYHCVTGVQRCVFFISSRRRHTRSLCDWSSDVCSSDLPVCRAAHFVRGRATDRASNVKDVVSGWNERPAMSYIPPAPWKDYLLGVK